MSVEGLLRQATTEYYEAFRAADWQKWRDLIADDCVFMSPLGVGSSADNRLIQMQAATVNPANLSYAIIGVLPEHSYVEVSVTFRYHDDGIPMTRNYVACFLWRISGPGTKLIRHLTGESAESEPEAQIAAAFSRLYHSQRKPMPVSGQIVVSGQIRRIVRRDGICNVYIVDDRGNEWWCRGDVGAAGAGDCVKVEGVMGQRGRGWCVDVGRVEGA